MGIPSTTAAASPSWSIVPSANTGSSFTNQLNGVSCVSASNCMAVGSANNSSAAPQTLVEQWNGTAWSIQPSPNTGTSDTLNAVSCAPEVYGSGAFCVAVGSYNATPTAVSQTLVEEWNGYIWYIEPSANSSPTDNDVLTGVSCASVGPQPPCVAVGYYYSAPNRDQTLAEQYDPTAFGWEILPTPDPSSSGDNNLSAVSCTASFDCEAVGFFSGTSRDQTLVMQGENGANWTVVPSPNTSSSQDNILSAVSCTSATACAAVGEINGSSLQTLAEEWNGSTWSIVPTQDSASDEDNDLAGVSCTSASACWAVGTFNNGSGQTLIEEWNGTAWTSVSSPDTPGNTDDSLNAVSCTSTTACAAVSSYAGVGFVQTLIAMLPGLPVVSSVNPDVGSTGGGLTVTISGSNFVGATAVDFGAIASPSFMVTSDTTITAQVPPAPGGRVDVTVTSPRGTSATSSTDIYAYLAGYDLAGSDGGVFVFPTGQSSGFFGSLPGLGVHVNNIVGIVPTNQFSGYNLVGSDGGVFVFPVGQSAGFYGSLPGLGVTVSNIVGIVPTNNYQGYDLVGSDGGVFVFPTGQSAGFYGSLPALGVHVNDIVGIVATPGGGGYFLVGRDGGVFTFGNAPFFGSLPSLGISVHDITGIASTPDGNGYYVVGANGAVYAFGDATSFGSLPSLGLSVSNIVSIVPTPDGKGYWLIGSDGGVFAFGDATSQGSLPGLGVSVNSIIGAVPTI